MYTKLIRKLAWLSMLLTGLCNASPNRLRLAADGQSDYQIVIPDDAGSDVVSQWLAEVARLVQAAFAANSAHLTVVHESERDASMPGVYLGDTAFARQAGLDVKSLDGWEYIHLAIGPDLIIAGHDHDPPLYEGWFFPRIGTAKGAADFLRQYVGTRFLYPDVIGNVQPKSSAAAAARVDFAVSPAIEFLPTPVIDIPVDLDIRHAPMVRNNVGERNLSFWGMANNMFPRVDDALLAHTWDKAVTVAEHYEAHPDWFALIGGERVKRGQFCLSNPGFQERIYTWHRDWLRRGFKSVNILQPDGFQPCQCPACHDLYGTGNDWKEKIWIFNLKIAERLLESVPEGILAPIPYVFLSEPPNTFNAFPENVVLQFIGTNEEDLDKWRDFEIPGGLTSGVHNWIANLGSRYTPMRTPLFLAAQVRRFRRHHITSTFRDGVGQIHGLEGPAYYVWGRMFDDPDTNQAAPLKLEFIEAAFGPAAAPMRRFYDRLYHGIELYAQYLGTRNPGWTYVDIYGRRHKHLSDPFQLLGFLYTPRLLNSLEDELAQADSAAATDKVRARLSLVRRELTYIRHLATVIHRYHAYQTDPDQLAIRDRLLDAIDARNALIDAYYNDRGHPLPMDGWPNGTLFPPPGHSANHLRLAYNEYQGPFRDTPLNWDTAAMRSAPGPEDRHYAVFAAGTALTLDDERWSTIASEPLAPLPGEPAVEATADQVRLAYDQDHLYIRFDCVLSESASDPKQTAKGPLSGRESVDVYLGPLLGKDIYYRFMGGLTPSDRHEAARGLIDDFMNLLHDRDDPDWTGDWIYDTDVDPERNRWVAFFAIPFDTLGVDPPKPNLFWRANFGRVRQGQDAQLARSAWSAVAPSGVDDVTTMGTLAFALLDDRETHRRVRRAQGFSRIPESWQHLPDVLPAAAWGDWFFRLDPLDQGLRDGWHLPDADDSDWDLKPVPAWYAEAGYGRYHGDAWYRVRFTPPEKWQTKTLRIRFGAVDEEAWVYLNGQLIREHSKESEGRPINELYDRMFHADAKPEIVYYGAENLLAVRVRNTVGGGGITRPVMIQATE